MRKHFSVDLAVQMPGIQPRLGYPLVAADLTAGKVPELDGKSEQWRSWLRSRC